MEKNRPLFSIVMPTRNRAHLLCNALRSAINQDFDDYEIVVIANDCHDNTREVVKSMANSKVRYFETDKMLTMPENWEFAWSKAQGKYITYLSDDDALTPSALSFLAKNTLNDSPPIVSWEEAVYYYPDWSDTKLKNTLLFFFYGPEIIENTSTEIMRKQLAHFNFQWNAPIPRMMNCIANRDFFETWRQKLGRLFFTTCPDYSFAWIVVNVCSNIRIVHKPLSLHGNTNCSIGSDSGLGNAAKEYLKEFGEFNFFEETETDLPISINHIAATFMRVNTCLQRNNIQPETFDHASFNISLSKQLMECKKLLPHWDKLVTKYLDKTKSFSLELQQQINQILSQPSVETNMESMRELHHRTQQIVLQDLSHITRAISTHMGDVQCGLSVLALQNEFLVDPEWSHMYLFGERINTNNIYKIATHTEQYYNLLLKGRKLRKTLEKPISNPTFINKLKNKIKSYAM